MLARTQQTYLATEFTSRFEAGEREAELFTIIIPTRNEAHSIGKVISELFQYLASSGKDKYTREVSVIDDSDDWDTVHAARKGAASWSSAKFTVLHREPNQNNGLTGAILAGLSRAKSEYAVVMDGDGQHPPSAVVEIMDRLESGSDLVFASRYRAENGDRGLSNVVRKLASRSINAALREALDHGARCTDPLTGLFGICWRTVRLPRPGVGGWKAAFLILLENQSTARYSEVGFRIRMRVAGESKMTLLQGVRIIWELQTAIAARRGQ